MSVSLADLPPLLDVYFGTVPERDWDLLLPIRWGAMSVADQVRWLPMALDPWVVEMRGRIKADPEGHRRLTEELRALMGLDSTAQLTSDPICETT